MSQISQGPGYAWPAAALAGLVLLGLWTAAHKAPPAAGTPLAPWRELAPLLVPRRALAAAAGPEALYALGGVDGEGRYVTAVEYAPFRPDGSLGPWRLTTPLPAGRFYLAAAVVEGHLYAIGGGSGPLGDANVPQARVERAPILPGGALGPWEPAPPLGTARRGLKVVRAGGRLYALGGYDGRFLTTSERLAPDGRWRPEDQTFQVDRYIHAAAAWGRHLYLVGGHMRADAMTYGDVEWTTAAADGDLAPWRVAPVRLGRPRFMAEAFVLGQTLYVAGGHDGGRRLAGVEMSALGGDGEPGPWAPTRPLRHARSAAAAAVHGGWVYVLGGMGDEGVLASVEGTHQAP